jgi:hypothetical protein
MKTIYPSQIRTELKELGIDILTGEACAFNLRLLCDVDANGLALLREYFGDINLLAKPWNQGEASVMLPRGCFTNLIIYAQLRKGCAKVITDKDGYIHCLNPNDPPLPDWLKIEEQFNAPKAQPQHEGRNIHQMSDRSI